MIINSGGRIFKEIAQVLSLPQDILFFNEYGKQLIHETIKDKSTKHKDLYFEICSILNNTTANLAIIRLQELFPEIRNFTYSYKHLGPNKEQLKVLGAKIRDIAKKEQYIVVERDMSLHNGIEKIYKQLFIKDTDTITEDLVYEYKYSLFMSCPLL